VLVSGGIDSTYLYEKIRKLYPSKCTPVNCYNPYEQNDVLTEISQDPKFIQIRPAKQYNYREILQEAFMKLPEARQLKKEGKYHKKIFPCCYHIKHKAFMDDPLFKQPESVVVSGIKRGDGSQRRIWLLQMSRGTNPRNIDGKPTYFHRHLGGQLYCYPFRDHVKRELSDSKMNWLRNKYPTIKHTGCFLCPVLVLFDLKNEGIRYVESVKYAQKLGVYGNESIVNFK